VNDLSKNQQGFTDLDGIKIAAAWPHCPATPPELGNIPRLGPQPSTKEVREFERKIAERELYAMGVQKKFTEDSGRFICPAAAGKIGCPIRGKANMDKANEEGLTSSRTHRKVPTYRSAALTNHSRSLLRPKSKRVPFETSNTCTGVGKSGKHCIAVEPVSNAYSVTRSSTIDWIGTLTHSGDLDYQVWC